MIKSNFPVKSFLRYIKYYLQYNRSFEVSIGNANTPLKFASTNFVTKFRYETFFFKEPETLAWIDQMDDGSTLWDIGANVGLYSIYFLARQQKGNVVAFEPHPSNLVCLIDNLFSNNFLNQRTTIVPNPIYSENSFCNFHMNSNIVGDSNHTISKKASTASFFKSPTLTLDSLISSGLPCPDYLKIDVDGNELDIVQASDVVLSNPKLKSILIELDIANQEETTAIVEKLSSFGFKEKDRFNTQEKFNKVSPKKLFNVIFTR